MLGKPWDGIRETAVLELVGADEQIDQNELGAAVSFTLPGEPPSSGELLSFTFISSDGDIQTPSGQLLIFDADPGHNAGDDGSGVSAAEWKALIGEIDVGASDWKSEDNAAWLSIKDEIIPFHAVDTLYFVWRHTDATSLNDGAGDDEVLEVNVWYARWS